MSKVTNSEGAVEAAADDAPAPEAAAPGPVDPDLRELVRSTLSEILARKAEDVVIVDVRGRTSYCDLFILATGAQARQVRAMAEGVVAMIKRTRGKRPAGVEGTDTGRWVLVDLGDVLLHVFDGPMRGYYDLDGLWVDAPRLPLESFGYDADGRDLEALAPVEA